MRGRRAREIGRDEGNSAACSIVGDRCDGLGCRIGFELLSGGGDVDPRAIADPGANPDAGTDVDPDVDPDAGADPNTDAHSLADRRFHT